MKPDMNLQQIKDRVREELEYCLTPSDYPRNSQDHAYWNGRVMSLFGLADFLGLEMPTELRERIARMGGYNREDVATAKGATICGIG